MLRNIVETVISLLKQSESESQLAVVATPALIQSREAAFEDHLSSLVAQNSTVLAGVLELIGLEDIRDALGEAWSAIAEQINEFAAAEIARCLDPTDIFRPHGEASFLIHFDSLDKQAADRKAKRIALRIKARLVERFPQIADDLSVEHFLAEVDTGSLSRDGSLADALYANLIGLRDDAKQAARQSRRSFIRQCQLVFAPAWDPRSQVTTFNRCVLDTRYTRTPLEQHHDHVNADELVATYAEIDYLILARAVETLHRLVRTSRDALLLVPVNYRTIAKPRMLAEYVRLLEAVPKPYCNLLAVELCGIPRSCQPSRLAYLSKGLDPYFKHIVIEVAHGHPSMSMIADLGAWAISIDLSHESSTDAGLALRLRQIATAAEAVNIHVIACGADSVGLALIATGAGFAYVSGSGIHLPARDPRPPLRLMPLPRSHRLASRRVQSWP